MAESGEVVEIVLDHGKPYPPQLAPLKHEPFDCHHFYGTCLGLAPYIHSIKAKDGGTLHIQIRDKRYSREEVETLIVEIQFYDPDDVHVEGLCLHLWWD